MLRTVAALALVGKAAAYNNGMAKKPPMGWQTWCSVGPCGEDHCHADQIMEMADTLVSSGMKDLGYDWIVLVRCQSSPPPSLAPPSAAERRLRAQDDCWHPSRAANGSLVPFPRFFPNGMKCASRFRLRR